MTDDSAGRFLQLELSGSPAQRGAAHGESLRERIHQTVDFYRQLFSLGDEELEQVASEHARRISVFKADYADEIEAIAQAARLPAYTIFALNSRSEILNNCDVAECTAISNSNTALLGQNWDWSQALESLLVMLRYRFPDGHQVCTLTEPGILAKIGMNSSGLGVCLNILKTPERLAGVPVHILLRGLLDCREAHEAFAMLELTSVGKASHVLLGDAGGEIRSTEFAGSRSFPLQAEQGILVHTNHYLADEGLNQAIAFPTTYERYAQSLKLVSEDSSSGGIEAMLRDQSAGELSICRPYSLSLTPGYGQVGTVCTLVMDLAQRRLKIWRGPDSAAPPYEVLL